MRNISSALFAVLLTGCVIIPYPLPSTHTLSEEKTKFLTVDKTTYAEVVEELGEPEYRFIEGNVPDCFLHSDREVESGAQYAGHDWSLCFAFAISTGTGGRAGVTCEPEGQAVLRLGFDHQEILVDYVALKVDKGCWGTACLPVVRHDADADELWKNYWKAISEQNVDASSLSDLCRAAEGGNTEAEQQLSEIWRHGNHGIRKDLKNAYVWACRASLHMLDVPPMLLRTQLSDAEAQQADFQLSNIKPGDCLIELRSGKKDSSD